MTIPIVRLAPRQTHRCLHGHPWIFRSEIEPSDLLDIANGAAVEVHDARGKPIGRGFASTTSQITVRLATRLAIPLDRAFLCARLQTAIAHRETTLPGRAACRLVSSEGDLLPGLIVERYADRLVFQTTTSGMDARRDEIIGLLEELCRPIQIVERNDFPARTLEGLAHRTGVVRGGEGTTVSVRLGDIDVDVDLLDPHKTGAYLDQVESHRALGPWTPRGGRIADVFAHRGGFALHALQAGAASAVAIDTSPTGLSDATRAAARLGFSERFTTVTADAFRWLREQVANKSTYDLVILDPPAFARTRTAVAGALRGYRDLHVQALRLLKPGGRLASWSCSSHVDEAAFLATAVEAAADAKRTVRFDTAFGQPIDHPWLPAAPETHYLKGFLLTVLEC